MTKTIRLNDLQLVLLSNALARDNGSLVPLPESCNEDTRPVRTARLEFEFRHARSRRPS